MYQDLALCDNLSVVANLYLGRETRKRNRLLARAQMQARASEVIRELAVTLPDLRRPVAALSGGQRQAVAVSRAVLWGSKIVMLDEPTAALGVEQTAMVYRLVRSLRERGLGVVLISHNLTDVFAVADEIAVLRLGRNAGAFRPGDTAPNKSSQPSPVETPSQERASHDDRSEAAPTTTSPHPAGEPRPGRGRGVRQRRRTDQGR